MSTGDSATSPPKKLSEHEKKQMLKELQKQAYEALLCAFGVENKVIDDDVKKLLNIEEESPEEKRKIAYEAMVLATTFNYSSLEFRDDVLARLRNQLHITDSFHRECQIRVNNNSLLVQFTGEASGSNNVGETSRWSISYVKGNILRLKRTKK
ncbi:unnamed protein product [Arabidopsis lyrata]|uniref:Predicted protein n=1 Tax=Arabidopsis lyrata subsp. lyrata TaxID=81972 RepID=D7LVQ9_ARALL|nr:uncharacterized protein LOC9312476 [Arabidopsis lyrata subsp. lyrata]XP_020881318.1 uncharacterized protein LOC9312476 [Arabidopsis lyrata subsp. lyrata]XP_020881319.1 uncharacterized protein LOC9312476 [Arabidopsis lyrata subsp. lyrata]EFH52667.1 predicted protein [Arabidopsis lyrata subsp. lyrata]CAH8268917.1 unnamed protein product [Arabidopsis lyrata]|eukprot:XP_002876408.1 uncharacterized protein LOC9312476 [Arabidopsis lyrata subsp. lyrata]